MINRFFNFINKPFIRNVITIASGATIAQIVTIISTPILTRIFTPDDFGILSIVTSISAIITIFYTLQYDMVLVIEKKDDNAKKLLGLSLKISILFFCIMLIISLAAFYVPILNLIGYHNVPVYVLFFAALVGLFKAFQRTLNYWNTRIKSYKVITISLVIATVISTLFRIIFGYGYGGTIILIIGALLVPILSSIIQMAYGKNMHAVKEGISLLKERASIKRLLYDYRDFPMFRMPQSLLNTVGQNIPNLLLIAFFGPSIAGSYVLANKMVKMPGMLISTSIRNVFFQKSAEIKNNEGSLFKILLRTTSWLAVGGIIPFTAISILSPMIFSFVFGENWDTAGVYASILAAWMFTVFCNTPSTATMPVLRKQKRYLVFNIVSLIVRTVALIVGALTGGAFEAILYFALTGALYNILIIVDVHIQAYRYEKC